MNISLQKMFSPFKWLLFGFLWLAVLPRGSSQGVVFVDTFALSTDTIHVSFEHFFNFDPSIATFPGNGQASLQFVSNSCGIGKNYEAVYVPNTGFTGYDYFEVNFFNKGFSCYFQGIPTILAVRVAVYPSYLHAEDDYATTTSGNSVELLVLNNDTTSANSLTLNSVTSVSGGTVTVTDSLVSFTPDTGFEGVGQFTYVVCDDAGNCDLATASVCVTPPQPPTYDSIFIFTKKNTPQVILLPVAGDSIVTPPSNGSLVYGGVVQYVPNTDYVGNDKVVFQDSSGSVQRVVEIKVLDAPTANVFLENDVAFTPIDEEIEIDVLANDIGGDNLQQVTLPNGTTTAEGGTLTVLAKGLFNYVPPAGFQGIDYFQYQASPGVGGNPEIGTAFIVVSDMEPAQTVFPIHTPKNTPLVIDYNIPIEDYEYLNISSPAHGVVDFYPGFQEVSTPFGQVVSGYNLLIYSPDQDYTGPDEFEFEYCVAGDTSNCPLVKILVTVDDLVNPPADTMCAGGECVWAGDTNYDGVVDVHDLLPVGLCMGEDGLPRPNAALEWYPQYANDWDDPFAFEPFDLKHVDTDGDGLIEAEDSTAIGQFYGMHHNLTPEPYGSLNPLPFYLDINLDSIEPGDIIVGDLYLGNDSVPAIDAYGLAFRLSYDPAIVEEVNITFNDNSWISYNSPLLKMIKAPFDGAVDAALTRTNGVAASGQGIIGTVEFVIVEEITGFRPDGKPLSTVISLQNSGMMNSAGFSAPLEGNDVVLTFASQSQDAPTKDEPLLLSDSHLKVYPNPTPGTLNLHLNGGPEARIEAVAVYSMTGQEAYRQDNLSDKHLTLDLGFLPNGVYALKAFTTGGLLSKKVQLVH